MRSSNLFYFQLSSTTAYESDRGREGLYVQGEAGTAILPEKDTITISARWIRIWI